MADAHLFEPNKMFDYIKQHAPWSEPDVIVPAAVWLASDDSADVTGKCLAGTTFNEVPSNELRDGMEDT